MSQEKEPKFYQDLLNSGKALDPKEAGAHLAEVEKILQAMEKGFAILEQVGRKPAAPVLANQKAFLVIKEKLSQLSKN